MTGTARKGIPNRTKVKDRKARSALARKLVTERQEKKRQRRLDKLQLARVAAGLPAFTEAELDKLTD
jgi:hypothetical protein